MDRGCLVFGLLLLTFSSTWASSKRENLQLDARCRSGEYHCGDGVGVTQERAREGARTELVSSIQALIMTRQSLSIREDESEINSLFESHSVVVSVLQLEGLELVDLEKDETQFHSMAFIAEADLVASMDKQRHRIRSMVSQARKAVQLGHIDDALRLSYWAFLLCHTVDTLQVELTQVELTDPKQAILEGMSEIIAGIQMTADPAVDHDELIGVPVAATYRGQPARFDMEMYTGAGMDRPHIANGRGYIELHWDPSTWDQRRQTLSPRVLYAYEGKMRLYPDLVELYKLYGQHEIDTYLNLEVVFPFGTEGPVKQDSHNLINVAKAVRDTQKSIAPSQAERRPIPGPIGVLAKIQETSAFLATLNAYAKDGRLTFHKIRPVDPGELFYVAVATPERVLGMFEVRADGFHGIGSAHFIEDLSRSEFSGAHKIWISGRKVGD